MKAKLQALAMPAGWAGVLVLALCLNLYLGLLVGFVLMSAVSIMSARADSRGHQSEDFAALQAAITAQSAAQDQKMAQLIDHFNNLRAEEAIRRSQTQNAMRIRG